MEHLFVLSASFPVYDSLKAADDSLLGAISIREQGRSVEETGWHQKATIRVRMQNP
ncbi:hypothetical protein ACPOL_6097 [Acidisarcina polymorpha]|uniref:Uncharacterized protein n=1 Tax=Acidisarcina polymorpha TaxID=2211140 RepID=A0A2Z5G8D8_9BACT|nr:hypothetical protein ACPOL_6097 [Acidisarcina polymorpha]